jgi:carbamoyl-phosphate synthase large subunit
MKVMVTGAGALLGQGIIRSLLKSSLQPEILAVDPSPLAPALYWVPHRALVPMAKDPKYLDVIESLLRDHRPDAVLVGTDVELELFARHREDLERRYSTWIVVSSPEVVATADDKWATFRFLRDHGFPAPASALPGDESELIAQVGFPLVVKPRVGARSVGVSVVRNRAQLARAVEGLEAPVIQECVGSDAEEYTAGTLTFDRRCDASIVMRRDLRDGNTYRAFVEPYPELNEVVRRMAVALGAHGPANFQFRLGASGQVQVFEINARFSGTTPLRMHAGFNEVEMVLRKVVKGEAIVQPPIERMTLLRYFTETVVRPDQLVRPV